MLTMARVSSLRSGEQTDPKWTQVGGGRRECLTEEEMHSTDRNVIDCDSQEKCLNKSLVRSEYRAVKEVGAACLATVESVDEKEGGASSYWGGEGVS